MNHRKRRFDNALATALRNATTQDEMIEAEDAICERLDISGDETEQGLTRYAVEQIERFVSENSSDGRWTYEELPASVTQ